MFIEKLLQLMAEKKASDIFISAGSPISIKIQGNIMPVNPQPMDAEMHQDDHLRDALAAPDRAVRARPRAELLHAAWRASAASASTSSGRSGAVSAVIRFITTDIPKIADLSLPPVLSTLVMEKRGLILVVGATGSGKSTTLASMLDYRNRCPPGTSSPSKTRSSTCSRQEVHRQPARGGQRHALVPDALKNAMRQAPDCILIGEIRDLETMRMAITYALSGHLCLATLHANNSYHAMNRVISFFPLEVRPTLLQDLSASLKAVISQRLIKTIDGGRIPAVEVLLNTATSRS